MVKPLSFKGDKKSGKKRKRLIAEDGSTEPSESKTLTTAAADQDDDSWVNAEIFADITGPIVFVLPTDVPSALSCDVTGKLLHLRISSTTTR